jgi:hypothetical protein
MGDAKGTMLEHAGSQERRKRFRSNIEILSLVWRYLRGRRVGEELKGFVCAETIADEED